MDTLVSVRDSVGVGDWVTSIVLSVAYFLDMDFDTISFSVLPSLPRVHKLQAPLSCTSLEEVCFGSFPVVPAGNDGVPGLSFSSRQFAQIRVLTSFSGTFSLHHPMVGFGVESQRYALCSSSSTGGTVHGCVSDRLGCSSHSPLSLRFWSDAQASHRINWLELEPVCLVLPDFAFQTALRHVLLRTDNTTVACYVIKQRGGGSLILRFSYV